MNATSCSLLRKCHLMKVWGNSARPDGRTQYWHASPLKANLRNFLRLGRMETWMYASFRSMVMNQSSDLICVTVFDVSILNLNEGSVRHQIPSRVEGHAL